MKYQVTIRACLNYGARAAFALLMFTQVTTATAAELWLTWDAVNDPDVGLYRISWGTSSGNYSNAATTTATATTVGGLIAGQQYFFAVRACNASGTECSDYSNQVSHTAAATAGATSVCASSCSLWGNDTVPSRVNDADSNSVELGMRFRSDVAGWVTGVRFYKGPENIGTHLGSLWSNSGQLLAQATFNNETQSGWQEVSFSTPVAIAANTVYVVSYHSQVGRYAVDSGYFSSASSNGPLRGLSSGESGGNGVYLYGSGGFPNNSYNSSNYWVDVVFTTDTSK